MSKQIGDRQIQFKARKELRSRRNDNSLVLAGGRNGAWTPHDMRRTGATMMQKLGIVPDTIDRCQNHVLPGSKVRRHYLHYDFVQQKLDAWEELGKELQNILAAGVTVQEKVRDVLEPRAEGLDQDGMRRNWVRRRPQVPEATAA
jgi:hypothetical protein